MQEEMQGEERNWTVEKDVQPGAAVLAEKKKIFPIWIFRLEEMRRIGKEMEKDIEEKRGIKKRGIILR
jgi:hypothetical protein